ncbi:MAG: hypothetical protein Q9222_002724 [Ikaeria aurantiellina]
MVVQHIPWDSLGSWALVHSSCRRLAHSLQFSSVDLGTSKHSSAVLAQLRQEAEDAKHSVSGKRLSIGSFIRHLSLSLKSPDTSTEDNFPNSQPDVNAETEAVYHDNNIKAIEALLSQRTVLPRLYTLDWDEPNFLQPSFFRAVRNSTVQRLYILNHENHEVPIREIPQSLQSSFWPLRSLQVTLGAALGNITLDVRDVCEYLLFPCAPTLESLNWEGGRQNSIQDGHLTPPDFASLSDLKLSSLEITDKALLQALIHDNLVFLAVGEYFSRLFFKFFKKRGKVPGLQSLVWHMERVHQNALLPFLRANTHLLSLAIPNGVPSMILDQEIIPTLGESFSNMTSLSLAWDSPEISRQALDGLSKLVSLQKLHLRAQDRQRSRWEWLINHEDLRFYLVSLRRLKKLAITKDTYLIAPEIPDGDYYEYESYRDAAGLDDGYTEEVYKQDHQERMLREATRYIKEMPALNWLHFGQLSMPVESCVISGRKIIKPQRLSGLESASMLRKIFRWRVFDSHDYIFLSLKAQLEN